MGHARAPLATADRAVPYFFSHTRSPPIHVWST